MSVSFTAADRGNVAEFIGAFTNGNRTESAIRDGWVLVSTIVAEHGDSARTVVESIATLPGKSAGSRNNAWTAVKAAVRLLELVDSTDDPTGTAKVATEFNYLAAAKAGKGRSVVATVNAMRKDETRFSSLRALGDALERARREALKAEKDAAEGKEPKAEATLDSDLSAMLKRVHRIAETYSVKETEVLARVTAMLAAETAQATKATPAKETAPLKAVS